MITTDTTVDETLVAEVCELFGPVAAREFAHQYPSRVEATITKLRALPSMTDAELVVEAEGWIVESALVSRFRGNFEDVHCMATACYAESQRRQVAAGADERCGVHSLYQKAHDRAMRSQGHTPRTHSCLCGTAAS